jgi:hypothetical protein
MNLPRFEPYVQSQERDAFGRLVETRPLCVLCGDWGIVDSERRCRACWRATVLTPAVSLEVGLTPKRK